MPKKNTKTSPDKKNMQDQDKIKVFASWRQIMEAIEDVIEHILGCDTEGKVDCYDSDFKIGPIVAKNVHFNGITYPVVTAISDHDSVDFRFYEQENPTHETVPALQKSVYVSKLHVVTLPITDETPEPCDVQPNK